MMTHQEIFNKVITHLHKQGCRSRRVILSNYNPMMNRTPATCAYRGDNGTSCAIGCLIPDELYDNSIEGKNVIALTQLMGDLPKYISNITEDVVFLRDLQRLHDNTVSTVPKFWKADMLRKARKIAEQYNLKMPVLGDE